VGALGVLPARRPGAVATVLDRAVRNASQSAERDVRRESANDWVRAMLRAFASVGLLVASMPMPSAGLAQALPGPSLGGTPAAFEQLLGGANDGTIGAQLHYLRCAGTDIDQFIVLAPNDQVWTIQRTWCDLSTMPPEQPFADAAQYLPPDAVPGETFTTELGESGVTYLSPSLGTLLPSALFHDCTGAPVPLGTLFVVADAYGGWFMGPGSCP
jgi:hypothetical protein